MRKRILRHFALLALAALILQGCQGAPAVRPAAAPEPRPAARHADSLLTLAAPFTDNMVLQRDAEVPIWGRARPGDPVTVILGGKKARATAGPDGAWTAKLPAMKAGIAGEMTVASPAGEVKLRNVAIGEVWLCSGQSNMARSVREAAGGTLAAASADYPDIRMFRVQRIDSAQKNASLGAWRPANKNTAGEFSAVAYFFGLRLYKSLGIPIGLLEASWGGSTAESWISAGSARANPTLAGILSSVGAQAEARDRLSRSASQAPAAQPASSVGPADTTTNAPAADSAASSAVPARPRPRPAPKPVDWSQYPSKAFDMMIAPLVPYEARGVVWYQGETNAEDGRGLEYRRVLPGLINNWRQVWGKGNLHFLVVQLPAYKHRKAEPSEGSWAEVREAQLLTAEAMPNVDLTVTIDLGSSNNIHPGNKEDVGKRLAVSALENVYRKNVVGSGPVFQSMRVTGPSVIVTFKNVGGGLEARGGELKGFALAGADRRFFWAQAAIDGDKVVVASDKVARPVAVRYGWADNPACNLYNREGFPASPFRTDDWPRPATPADSAAAAAPRPGR